MRKLTLVVTALVVFFTGIATAYARELLSHTGRVIYVEPSVFPTKLEFRMDTGTQACRERGSLYWQNDSIDNMKAVYATLLAALITQRPIEFFYYDDAACHGTYLHFWSE